MSRALRSAGLFDLQVNGFAGIDFNATDIDAPALDHALEAMLATGVTACLPTLITAPPPVLAARFEALDRAVAGSRLGPAMVPGYHLEGPFLNPAEGYAGCHPACAMIAPDARLVERIDGGLSRPILLVTLAPELPGSEAFIGRMVAAGKLVAIGHSCADAGVVAGAADAGARLSTHLGNGVPQLLPKLDNTIFAQLAEERLFASVIADGIHLPRPALKAMLRAKGPDRVILVTDAVSAAATPPGLYPFAGMLVEHAADGSVRVPGARSLAGSALTLDRAVRNLVEWGMATPDEALRFASTNPLGLLAPALEAHRIALTPGQARWSDGLVVAGAEPGRIARTGGGGRQPRPSLRG